VLLAETEPGEQRKHAHVSLRRAAKGVDDGAIDQEEVGAPRRHLGKAHQPPHDPVIHRGEPAMMRLAGPLPPHRPDHLRAVAPTLEHVAQELGRILEVRCKQRGGVAGDLVQRARNRQV
jgi:hypothetical protein